MDSENAIRLLSVAAAKSFCFLLYHHLYHHLFSEPSLIVMWFFIFIGIVPFCWSADPSSGGFYIFF